MSQYNFADIVKMIESKNLELRQKGQAELKRGYTFGAIFKNYFELTKDAYRTYWFLRHFYPDLYLEMDRGLKMWPRWRICKALSNDPDYQYRQITETDMPLATRYFRVQ